MPSVRVCEGLLHRAAMEIRLIPLMVSCCICLGACMHCEVMFTSAQCLRDGQVLTSAEAGMNDLTLMVSGRDPSPALQCIHESSK